MSDSAPALAVATVGVLAFLCPAMALFFGGVPSRQTLRWLGGIGLGAVSLASAEWMLLGEPVDLALFQGALATVAVLTVASIGLRGGRRVALTVTLAIWLVLVVVPIGHAVFDIEDGLVAAGIGSLDFAGACVLGVAPGTAAIAIALAHRWSGVVVEGRPRRPGWLFGWCALASILGFLAVVVGAELVIDETTRVLLLNTVLGGVGGAIGWTAAQVANVRRATPGGLVAGVIAGVIVVLPASPWLEPVAVMVLAVIASILGHITTIAFRTRDAKRAWASLIGICLVPASVGMVGAGIVAAGPGLLYSGHADLAEAQLQGLGAVLVLSFVATLLAAVAAFVVAPRVVGDRSVSSSRP